MSQGISESFLLRTQHILMCVSAILDASKQLNCLCRLLRTFRVCLDLLQLYGFVALRARQRRNVLRRDCTSTSATVVSVTLGSEQRYKETLQSWLANQPRQILIITVESSRPRVEVLVRSIGDERLQVFSIPAPDYRRQLIVGIEKVCTDVVVFADDRTYWGSDTLSGLLTALSDSRVGGVNTMQRVVSAGSRPQALSIWESFGALNLARRNILHSFLSHFNDGQVLNLSGRTVAYRTRILQDQRFVTAFLNDRWRGKYIMRTGDDNFLTTWILHNGWKTSFVTSSSSIIACSVAPDVVYIRQVLRWSRDTARWYLRDLNWALTHGGRKHLIRCLLNIMCNYLSDVVLIVEIGLLSSCALVVSFSRPSSSRSQL